MLICYIWQAFSKRAITNSGAWDILVTDNKIRMCSLLPYKLYIGCTFPVFDIKNV